jgi:hypothetical protein
MMSPVRWNPNFMFMMPGMLSESYRRSENGERTNKCERLYELHNPVLFRLDPRCCTFASKLGPLKRGLRISKLRPGLDINWMLGRSVVIGTGAKTTLSPRSGGYAGFKIYAPNHRCFRAPPVWLLGCSPGRSWSFPTRVGIRLRNANSALANEGNREHAFPHNHQES